MTIFLEKMTLSLIYLETFKKIMKKIYVIVATGSHNFLDEDSIYEGQKCRTEYDSVLDDFDPEKETLYYLQKKLNMNQCAWCKIQFPDLFDEKRCPGCNKHLTSDAGRINLERNKSRGLFQYSIRKVIHVKKIIARLGSVSPRWKLEFAKSNTNKSPLEIGMSTRVGEEMMVRMVSFTHKNFAINKISFLMSCGMLPHDIAHCKTQPGIFRCRRAGFDEMSEYVDRLEKTFKKKVFGEYVDDS